MRPQAARRGRRPCRASPRELLALVYLRVALINGCPLLNLRQRIPGDQPARRKEDRAGRDRRQQPASRRARRRDRIPEADDGQGQRVTDALHGRLRRHFSEAQIVELTAAIALENFRSKFNTALGVEAQGSACSSVRPR